MAHQPKPPTHPGTTLGAMLADQKIAPMAAAREMGMPSQRLYDIIKGRRGVTAETAVLLTTILPTTAEFWMTKQVALDLWNARQALKSK